MEYREVQVYELPPPTQGLAALAMLARLNALPPEELEPGPRFVTEFKRIRDECYLLRDMYITDPDFAAAPVEPFLGPGHVAASAARLRDGRCTVYLCAAHEHGNLTSLIHR